jgi:hypothetical protein
MGLVHDACSTESRWPMALMRPFAIGSSLSLSLSLACAALGWISGCERASFESLGVLPAAVQPPSRDAGVSSPAPAAADSSAAVLPVAGRDVTVAIPSSPAGAAAAGSDVVSGLGAGGSAAMGGVGGVAAAGGMGGAGGGPSPVMGTLGQNPFDVKAGYVVGLSDDLDTTTLYLFNASVTCDQISNLAWLAQLPANVQVIELMFPSNAATGSAVVGSLISYARGGTYSFSKTFATGYTLVLSANTPLGAVDGTLKATFPSGSVMGAFHAGFCATGLGF